MFEYELKNIENIAINYSIIIFFVKLYVQYLVGNVVNKSSVQSNGSVTVTTTPVTLTNVIGNGNENSNSLNSNQSRSIKDNEVTTTQSTTPIVTSTAAVKKNRPKTSSPTRHGPQQCQVNIFKLSTLFY